jgi:hypothetical protein
MERLLVDAGPDENRLPNASTEDELGGAGLGVVDGFGDCVVCPTPPNVFELVREYTDREPDAVDARAENASYGRAACVGAWEPVEDLLTSPFPKVVTGLSLLEPESFQSKSEKSAIDSRQSTRRSKMKFKYVSGPSPNNNFLAVVVQSLVMSEPADSFTFTVGKLGEG